MTVDIGAELLAWVDANKTRLSDWNQTIWNFAETAWREERSAAWYVARLREEGFEVEEGSAGMPPPSPPAGAKALVRRR